MIERIGVKKLILSILLIIIIIGLTIFGIILAMTDRDKSYELKTVSESEYTYFVVYTNEKYGVINLNGELIVDSIYSSITIPNPTKAVFICVDENRKHNSFK